MVSHGCASTNCPRWPTLSVATVTTSPGPAAIVAHRAAQLLLDGPVPHPSEMPTTTTRAGPAMRLDHCAGTIGVARGRSLTRGEIIHRQGLMDGFRVPARA